MSRLKNKVAIVTGGASGMGASHVRLFAKEGAKVVLTDINEEAGEVLATELGADVHFVKQDVTSEADWNKVIAETESKFGPANVLVNNAGISKSIPLLEMTEEQRSEEHTSELQSRFDIVCRLLLEKKKKK